MGTKSVVTLLASVAALCFAAGALAQPGNGAGRPNILLIIADDVGMDVTSDMYPGLIDGLVERYGPEGLNHPDYRSIAGKPASTPVLDDLARSGIRFTNVWAHPFCSPTRAGILSGLFGAATHVLTYQDALSQNHTSFVQLLRDEGGYATGIFGKWHIAGIPTTPGGEPYPGMKPKEAGFDVFRGNMHAAIGTFWNYDYQVQDAETAPGEWKSMPPPERSLPGIAPTTYAPVVKVADTIEWISDQEAADPDRPWFAWMAFNLSHATAQSAPSQMAVPNADTLDARSLAEMKACGAVFGTQDTGACSGEAQMRAMTNSLDTILGKLLEAVDALDRNTYVIYVGDNGTPMYGRPNLDFIDNMYLTRTGRGKGTVYESGTLVPLVVRGPGIAPGSVSTQYAHTVDLFSTALEIAGLDVPQTVSNSEGNAQIPLASVSLAPIVFGDATPVRDAAQGFVLAETVNLMTGGTQQVGARNGTHKIVCTDGLAVGDCEFYDLERDPLEEYPLAVPASCDAYASSAWTPASNDWHYCRLIDVVSRNSFL